MMGFTEKELDELDRAVGRFVHDPSQARFARLVGDYRRFVQSLPGYSFSIYDYDNDVSVREMLGKAMQLCNPSLREKAFASLKELDDAFLAETSPVEREGREGWHLRIPKNPAGELLEDIDSGNI